MHSHSTHDLEQIPGRDPTRLEETPGETQEDQEEEILEEAALVTRSRVDSWQAEEPKLERPEPSPSFSMEIAPRQGCSLGP